MLTKKTTVETVVALSKEIIHASEHIEITLDEDDLDLTRAEAKATYEEITDIVKA